MEEEEDRCERNYPEPTVNNPLTTLTLLSLTHTNIHPHREWFIFSPVVLVSKYRAGCLYNLMLFHTTILWTKLIHTAVSCLGFSATS